MVESINRITEDNYLNLLSLKVRTDLEDSFLNIIRKLIASYMILTLNFTIDQSSYALTNREFFFQSLVVKNENLIDDIYYNSLLVWQFFIKKNG